MKKQLLVVTLMFLLHQLLFGQISSDQWSAEDALGRKSLTYDEVGDKKDGKFIGMWGLVRDISKETFKNI